MTMTDTEAKALALVNEFRAKCAEPTLPVTMSHVWAYGAAWEALCRVIKREAATEARHAAELREQAERFDAFRQEVSDAIKSCMLGPIAEERLAPFILPAPDPLVEEEDPIDALVDLLAPVLTHSQGMAARERENRFRNALAALRKIGVCDARS